MSREIGQSRAWGGWINGALLVLALVSLAPLAWMLSVSFMPSGQASQFPPPLLPAQPTLDNYRELFARTGMAGNFLNSLGMSVGITLGSLLFNTLAGYAFAKLRFAGRERVFQALLAALVIPAQVAMLPLFLLMKQLGLVNTWGGVVVPALASVFGIFLVRQYARSIPDELLEAARIDGASAWQQITRVKLPVIKPILVVTLLMRMIDGFRGLEVVYVMTFGGPGQSTELFSLHIYKAAFISQKLGYSAALSVLLLCIVAALALAVLLIANPLRTRGAR